MADTLDTLEKVEQWLFTDEKLTRLRGATHERTLQVLNASERGERRNGIREALRVLSLQESTSLTKLVLQRLPELCQICGAPPDVQWTSIVFYQRFFTVRSPMEFPPLSMMFACVHLACKIEEYHEITLDKLFLHAEAFGVRASLQGKVAALELHLLEGLGFQLLVEPKPDIALRMLVDELQSQPCWDRVAHGFSLHPGDQKWQEIVAASESLLVNWSIRTEAVLRYPTSMMVTVALAAVLSRHFSSLGGDGGQTVETLQSFLASSVEEGERAVMRSMFQTALQDFEALSSLEAVTADSVKESIQNVTCCHQAFERLREEATERHEANRRERKRRWGEMKDANRRRIPTPFMQTLANFNKAMAAGNWDDAEGFVIHRPRDDIDMGPM